MDVFISNSSKFSSKKVKDSHQLIEYEGSIFRTQLLLSHISDPNRSGGRRLQEYFQKGGIFEGMSTGDFQTPSPLISIITVVFNGEKYIRQTILSVLNQSYTNIEYIIIDGGSTDKTLDIIREYDHVIDYWISEPDCGISHAFNKGITLSTGKIIGLINADDWYSPDALKKVVECHRIYPTHILHGDLQFWTDESEKSYVFHGNSDLIPYRSSINHPTVFVPRLVYEHVGLYNLKYSMAMDLEWLGRAKRSGVLFFHIGVILANMRRGGLSDRSWFASYWESAKARHDLQVPVIHNVLLLLQAAILTLSRKFLETAGLNGIIHLYRNKYSIGKKN